MALLKHKGGKIDVWDPNGKKVETYHYGPGLHKSCSECGQLSYKRCVSATGNIINSVHKARLS